MSEELKLLTEIWMDQKDFNRNFRPPAYNFTDRSAQTKDMVLYMMSELDEVLRKIDFKAHRRQQVRENRAAVVAELTDIFKYWVSLCLIWGVSPEEAIKQYWRKSMAVRARYSQEFLVSIDSPIALVDIDNVLCEYALGLRDWIEENYEDLRHRVASIEHSYWINSQALGIPEERWQAIKHEFRVSGQKARLPVAPGAHRFCESIHKFQIKIILLTSRPIKEYPNMYTDTLEWLSLNGLPYDMILWGKDKVETMLKEGLRPKVRFAVDDDAKYCADYAKEGIKTYHVGKLGDQNIKGVTYVRDLDDLITKEFK